MYVILIVNAYVIKDMQGAPKHLLSTLWILCNE
jgi:hypothetical protein